MHRGLDPVPIARNVSRRTRRGRACHVLHSAKSEGLISMESFEEYKRALLLEIDPRVVRYSEQPWTLEVNSGDIRPTRDDFKPATADLRFYTPDFTVLLADGRVLIIEVKKASPSAELAEKYDLVQGHCQQHGFEFSVLEGGHLSGALMRNCEYLVRTSAEYLKPQFPVTLDRLLELSQQRPHWNFSDLALLAPLAGFGVFVGIAKGIFQADVQTDLLSGQGAITPALGGLTHLELGFV